MKPYKQRAKKTNKYKSKYEESHAKFLENHGIPFDYEKVKLKYYKEHVYKLDFSLLSDKILIETKGYFTAADRQKMLDVKKNNPELDIRLLFMANQKIHKLSNTRYSDWCEKHGFKYHISKEAVLPPEWLEEIKKDDNIKKVLNKNTKG